MLPASGGGKKPSSRKFQPRVRKIAGQPSHNGSGAFSVLAPQSVPTMQVNASGKISSNAAPAPGGPGGAERSAPPPPHDPPIEVTDRMICESRVIAAAPAATPTPSRSTARMRGQPAGASLPLLTAVTWPPASSTTASRLGPVRPQAEGAGVRRPADPVGYSDVALVRVAEWQTR